MTIRFRIRGSGKTESFMVEGNWTLGDLVQAVRDRMGIEKFTLRYFSPPNDLDISKPDTPLEIVNLDGQTLMLVPAEDKVTNTGTRDKTTTAGADGKTATTGSVVPAVPFKAPVSSVSQVPAATPGVRPKRNELEELFVPWPELDGYIMLRVMPHDNSCMFTAFGGAVRLDDPARTLRRAVVEYFKAHPETYNKVTLDNKNPEDYYEDILKDHKWGGYIELTALSHIYNIEICAINVSDLEVIKIGEDKSERCVLIYSGHHYDRIVFASDTTNPYEWDETQWSTSNDTVLKKAQLIAKMLNERIYHYDASRVALICEICDWVGKGDKAMTSHTASTGHDSFQQVPEA